VVHYGSCQVFIPQSHKIGSIGSPWWKRLLTLTDDRLHLLSVNEIERTAYWDGIAAQLCCRGPRRVDRHARADHAGCAAEQEVRPERGENEEGSRYWLIGA
jgi:hypothetical protein